MTSFNNWIGVFMGFVSLVCLTLTSCSSEGKGEGLQDEALVLGELIDPATSWNSEGEKCQQLFNTFGGILKERSPIYADRLGFEGFEGRWSTNTIEEFIQRDLQNKKMLLFAKSISLENLSSKEKVFLKMLILKLEEMIEAFRLETFFFRISQQYGLHQSLPYTLSNFSLSNPSDIVPFLGLVRNAFTQIQNEKKLLKLAIQKGLTPPLASMQGVAQQIRKAYEGPLEDSPFMKALKNASLEKSIIDSLSKVMEPILTGKLIPELIDFADFIEEMYVPACQSSPAMSDLPQGKERYAHYVKQYTTTNFSPDEIHELGIREVQRIRKEMEGIKESVGFRGSLNEFNDFLRTDKQFFYDSKEDLLDGYRIICKKIDPALVKLFNNLPRLPYGVVPVPEYLEKNYTTARYSGGSFHSGKAGEFFANTYALNTRPKWEMEALSLHEAVPGHHLQISLEKELKNLPDFKQFMGFTVYVEGWGLYAESLGGALGLYQDPYSKYGQLTYEMWRAIRLVLDTGIHSKGWSRAKAISYFKENSAKTLNDIEVEVDRYIGWPGQALAYKMGELKITELRIKSETELGDKFDIKGFHECVLSLGSVPLFVLEEMVEEWIKKESQP